jgi:probable phosphoglycerate mutase
VRALTELVLLRHAETTWNAAGRWQGQADPPLSERGRAQVQAAAPELANGGFAGLYTSDLRRASETAAMLGRALGLIPQPDPRLREFHVGLWSGLTHAQIEAGWPGQYARFRMRELDFRPGGGEAPEELVERIEAAFDDIAGRHPDGRVLVVSHGGVARSLAGASLENLEPLSLRRGASGWMPA